MTSDPAISDRRPSHGGRVFPKAYLLHARAADRLFVRTTEDFPRAVSGRHTLLYEGNIYQLDGVSVAGQSTAVIAERLLRQYLDRGDSVFQKVIGEFSVIITDGEQGIAFRNLTSPHQIYYT